MFGNDQLIGRAAAVRVVVSSLYRFQLRLLILQIGVSLHREMLKILMRALKT
jgi:hypothetical protein